MAAVSIVTPAWNAAAHIAETIASVRAQSWQDWEWLIVDDGSTDDTATIVRAATAEDARIRLLQQSNAGPSAARNRAMAEASGAWFTFLDSDDCWHPGFLSTQLAIFQAHPTTDLVTGTAINRGGPFDGEPTRPPVDGYPVLSFDDMIRDETAVFIMTVFRRQVFETIGGLDERQWTSEDYDFWLRAAQAGFVFRLNPEPLAWYRVRGDSLSRQRIRMLEGLVTSYRKAAARMDPGAEALGDIEAQIARFESELLLERAKFAIEREEFGMAAAHLDALRARGGGALIAITAWLARHAPSAAVLAYRLRGWRPRSLRSQASKPVTRQVEAGTRFASQP